MSDTPRTDDSETRVRKNGLSSLIEYCYANDMAKLERELTAARAEIEAIMETLKSPIEVELDMIRGKIAIPDRAELDCIAQIKEVTEQRDEWKAKYIQQNKDLGCEMMDPDGTIWDYAKKVQSEIITVTEQRDVIEKKLRIELRGHPDSELWGGAGLIAATMRCVDALDEVTEQRDRLAEAALFLADLAEKNTDDGDLWKSAFDKVRTLAAVEGGGDE